MWSLDRQSFFNSIKITILRNSLKLEKFPYSCINTLKDIAIFRKTTTENLQDEMIATISEEKIDKVGVDLQLQMNLLPIVMVDDDGMMRSTISKILQAAGFSIAAFPNGQDALEYCLANPVQLVITDMKMPIKSGLELIRDLQREKPEVAVIAVSGDRGELRSAAEEDVSAVISKPFEPRDLISAIQKILPQP